MHNPRVFCNQGVGSSSLPRSTKFLSGSLRFCWRRNLRDSVPVGETQGEVNGQDLQALLGWLAGACGTLEVGPSSLPLHGGTLQEMRRGEDRVCSPRRVVPACSGIRLSPARVLEMQASETISPSIKPERAR